MAVLDDGASVFTVVAVSGSPRLGAQALGTPFAHAS